MCYCPVLIEQSELSQVRTNDFKKYMLVPCRQCLECRESRAKEWSLRCYFELQSWRESSFLTLTYESSPLVLVKKHVQDFIKRLRKSIAPKKIKYFLSGEYGDKRKRPHFHVIVFGHDFADKFFAGKSDRGNDYFKSPRLDKLWGYGMCTIQDVNYKTIGYCALYASPARKALPEHLQEAPEFNLMSQGLGVENILKNIDKYLKTDTIFVDGISHNIPKAVLDKAGLPVYVVDSIMSARLRKSKHYDALQSAKFHKDGSGYILDYVIEQRKIVAENKQKRFTKVL